MTDKKAPESAADAPAETSGGRPVKDVAPRRKVPFDVDIVMPVILGLHLGAVSSEFIPLFRLHRAYDSEHPLFACFGLIRISSLFEAVVVVAASVCLVGLMLVGLRFGRTFGWWLAAIYLANDAFSVVVQNYAGVSPTFMRIACVVFGAFWLAFRTRTYRPFSSHHVVSS